MATTVSTQDMSAVDYFKAKLRYETTPHELKSAMEEGKVFLIDVRDKDAYKAEHIAGAQNIPLLDLEKNLSKLPRNKTIVSYCWNITCAMAPHAALRLAEKGFQVQELIGGLAEWKGKGFSTETGPSHS